MCINISHYVKNTIRFDPAFPNKPYNFYDYTFSFMYVSYKDVDIFYNYYKAFSIIEIIKNCEKIYEKQIICDEDVLLHFLFQLLSKKENIDFNHLKGTTTMISYVPFSLLESKLQFFASFEC